MLRIANGIRALAAASVWTPDVIAIEDIVLHSGWIGRQGSGGAADGVRSELLPDYAPRRSGPGLQAFRVMSETRAYLKVIFGTTWPRAIVRNVHPSRVRGVIGAGRGRDAAKRQNMLALRQMARWTAPAEQDEADAYVVGLAALDDIRAAAWSDMARR